MSNCFIYRSGLEKGPRVGVQGSGVGVERAGKKWAVGSRGYTLVEILLATVITLLLMAVVVQMFGALGQSITDSRSILEATERLRSAAARLQMDLQGVTVTMRPPRNPDDGEGYFEYIEGPVVQTLDGPSGLPQAQNSELPGAPADTSVGDFDDILMFTSRSTGRPFTGNFTLPGSNTRSVQSDVAEIAWFIRGRTLYRRQLLVSPALPFPSSAQAARRMALRYYADNDISVRAQNGLLVPNTLSDLTRRECRYAHPSDEFPFDVRRWGQLGLPTLRESASWDLMNMVWPSASVWTGKQPPLNHLYPSNYFYFDVNGNPNDLSNPPFPLDLWTNDARHRIADNYLGDSNRVADDVILTNVIGFDVKAWEPARGEYVDLGYELRPAPDPVSLPPDIKHYPAEVFPDDSPGYPGPLMPGEVFYHRGYGKTNAPQLGYYAYLLGCYRYDSRHIYYAPRVYDTWSTHYENVGLYGLDATVYPPGRGTNGFDDDGNGIVDDENEKITSPPYPVPLRGIQVKIRIFEPDSRQVREVTVVQDFLPK
jgi:type II secretory pathway component PulJ